MNKLNTSLCGILLVSLLMSLLEVDGSGFDIRLYSKKHLQGRYIKIKVDEPCTNLPSEWSKQVLSVDPLGCVILYAEPNCRGLRRRLERWSWGSASLKDISFDNMITSLSPCPIIKKIVIEEL